MHAANYFFQVVKNSACIYMDLGPGFIIER